MMDSSYIPFSPDEEESFVILDDNPQDSIAQMSLSSFTIDQAVYTIGTLTQRIEELSSLLVKAHMSSSANNRTQTRQSMRTVTSLGESQLHRSSPKVELVDGGAQTELPCVSSSSQTISKTFQESNQQTDAEKEDDPFANAPESIRDSVSDLRSAMERLSAEKVTCLTSISERDRRISKLKKDLEIANEEITKNEVKIVEQHVSTRDEISMMREVISDNACKIEALNIQVSEQVKVIVADEKIKENQAIEIRRLNDEVLSLRKVIEMISKESGDGSDAVMVSQNEASGLSNIMYPFSSVPENRMHQ